MLTFQFVTMKIRSRLTQDICSNAIRQEYEKSIHVTSRTSALALIVLEMLTFQNVDFANLGQCHGVEHSLWCYSTATSNYLSVVSSIFTVENNMLIKFLV